MNFHEWFILTTEIHNHNTRSKFMNSDQNDQLIYTNNLFICTARTSHYALKKIKVHGAKIWNELPPDIQVITSFGLFNKKLKRHMVQNYKFII